MLFAVTSRPAMAAGLAAGKVAEPTIAGTVPDIAAHPESPWSTGRLR